jgi:hypothetical protein
MTKNRTSLNFGGKLSIKDFREETNLELYVN